MNWPLIYVGLVIPALLVLTGFGLVWYDGWERRRDAKR